MAATYLEITNELLRELNEVALTSATFAGAIGVQQHIKDCVNRAYLDIVNEESKKFKPKKWWAYALFYCYLVFYGYIFWMEPLSAS